MTNIFLAILFFIPIMALAASCDQTNSSCKTAQAQIKAMEDAGIKPSTVVAAPGVNMATEMAQKKEQEQPQPYKIPKPMYSPSPQKSDTAQKSTSQETVETKRKAAFKMFIPTDQTTEQKSDQQEFVFQPPKSPLQPVPLDQKPQMPGIQYQ